MDLFLRKVIHTAARDSYRVVLKDDGVEIEVGSIGVQLGSGTAEGWVWGIDNVVPMREADSHGTGNAHRYHEGDSRNQKTVMCRSRS